jgi:predicted ATP-binding protein involved in virulence
MSNLTINRISIKEFFRRYSFDIELNRKATFLIGYNGTGKTSLINIIRSALQVDVSALLHAPFSEIRVSFDEGTRRRPYLIVTKNETTDRNPSLSEELSAHNLLEMDDESLFIDPEFDVINSTKAFLQKRFAFNWLSINRETNKRRHPRHRHQSNIDAKLSSIFQSISEYRSELNNAAQDVNSDFNHKFFLSILDTHPTDVIGYTKIDRVKEKNEIESIFQRLNIPPTTYNRTTTEFFKKLPQISEGDRHTFRPDEFVLLSNAMRLHKMVKHWHKKEEKVADLHKYINKYVELINILFLRKKISFDARNRIVITNVDGELLRTNQLSSGEKQMLILLGEALLQRQSPTIYLADEPELSLHIEWQESLVDNILDMNPNAQIFFATHSPDIVGRFDGGVRQMKSLF